MNPRVALVTCLALALALALVPAPAARADFGFLAGAEGFDVSAISEGGAPDVQAGSHPLELRTSVGLRLEEGSLAPGGPYTDGDLRDLHIEEPPGLIENPAAVAQCNSGQFQTQRVSPFEASAAGESCPDKSQIGTVTVHTSVGGGTVRTFGIFSITPPPGLPSELGFNAYGTPIVLTPHIRQSGGEYGVTLDLRDLSQRFDLYGLELSLWGTPWALSHNSQRGNCLNEVDPEDPWGRCSVGRPARNPAHAYLTMPPSCTGPLVTTTAADSWQHPGAYLPDGEPDLSDPSWVTAASTSSQNQIGCDLLPFAPEVLGQLTTDRAASPTGYDLVFNVDESGLLNPKLLAPSQPRKAVVALPNGMTLNPSLAAGLGVCTPAQYAAETVSSPPGAGCPNDSKIGDFTVQSPLFEEPVAGAVFLAQPDDPASVAAGAENPFDSLIALYIVAKAPQRGVIVKVAGKVAANPASGQLTATFEGLPQLPYSHFRIHFREGQRSPLLTPPSCGTYQTAVDLTPWLEAGQVVHEAPSFPIAAGIEGTSCPSGAAPPFKPGAAAGDLNSNAGSYSPFYLHLSRKDTEQEITSYSAKLPPGLLGKIAGIPYCPEADIKAAAHETGSEEAAHPSCPAASEIGHTVSGYGVGPVLAYAPGGLYLAGPYHGSSFSIVAIDSATVGPFDLGTIIVRSAIRIDPRSAQVSVDSSGSDPIPHIIDGIPIHLRDIRVYIDRHELTLNPTSCAPFSVSSTLTGSAAPFTNPEDITATATVPFQAFNCSSLGFAPKFGIRLKGGTKRGDYPKLIATVSPRPGDANIAAATVTLPPTLFLAQEHIDTICTAVQMEAEACPPGSVYGHAQAITPLLAEPMSGPVYLRSSSSTLPDLVTVLHGQGIRIVLEGHINSNHGGLRATFKGVPDAPVSRFTMTINGGRKRGLLQNAPGGSSSLCDAPQIAGARFLGQANEGVTMHPQLRLDCGKGAKQKHSHRGGGH